MLPGPRCSLSCPSADQYGRDGRRRAAALARRSLGLLDSFCRRPLRRSLAPRIEELSNHRVTASCNRDPLLYCPDFHNTRAQMAILLDRTFGLTLY
jgi:hypothetical protein